VEVNETSNVRINVTLMLLRSTIRALEKQQGLHKFNVHGSVHRNNILVYKYQQDAQVIEFILSDNCSTCFGRHHHPSSGAQNNCNYGIW
jgi:hypothetical protein